MTPPSEFFLRQTIRTSRRGREPLTETRDRLAADAPSDLAAALAIPEPRGPSRRPGARTRAELAALSPTATQIPAAGTTSSG